MKDIQLYRSTGYIYLKIIIKNVLVITVELLFYEILIFEAGKAYQKIKVGYEDLYLYERKNKKWLEIRKLPKENIYKLLEELEVS